MELGSLKFKYELAKHRANEVYNSAKQLVIGLSPRAKYWGMRGTALAIVAGLGVAGAYDNLYDLVSDAWEGLGRSDGEAHVWQQEGPVTEYYEGSAETKNIYVRDETGDDSAYQLYIQDEETGDWELIDETTEDDHNFNYLEEDRTYKIERYEENGDDPYADENHRQTTYVSDLKEDQTINFEEKPLEVEPESEINPKTAVCIGATGAGALAVGYKLRKKPVANYQK